MAKYVIVFVGNLFNGSRTFHGPFDSYDEAAKWVDSRKSFIGNQHVEFVEMLAPTQ